MTLQENKLPIVYKTAVPLLASRDSDNRVKSPGWFIEERYRHMQELRWSSAITLERDFSQVLEFVSPSDKNLACSSTRILSLLVRVCIEIESNFKAILTENGVSKQKQENIRHFRRVEQSHSLSNFSARIHGWSSKERIFQPFRAWGAKERDDAILPWYHAYGKAKHNIFEMETYATFENLCAAISAYYILLISQFGHDHWGPSKSSSGFYEEVDFECSIGSIVEVRFPKIMECRVLYDLSGEQWRRFNQFDFS